MSRWLLAIVLWLCSAPGHAIELHAYGGEADKDFAGCLNCPVLDERSVCHRHGDYGSLTGNKSIWNRFSVYGSKFEPNSPWNVHGKGLLIVGQAGENYGRFSASTKFHSRLPVIESLIERLGTADLTVLRDLYCGP